MALARFRDLCMDAVDVDGIARFWAERLGLQVEKGSRGAELTGPTPEHTLWINQVDEPKTVKHRVHLDIHAASDDVPDGATPVTAPGELKWRVMNDPEGGEFCVFPREEVPSYRLYEVIVDSQDGPAMAAWWGEVFGAPVEGDYPDYRWLEDVPGMPFDALGFGNVPEPKTVKNRVHWDVVVEGREAIDELVRRGASILREPDDDIDWFVLADPEGNEFCVFGA